MRKYQHTNFRLSWLQVLLAALLALYGFCTHSCRDQYPVELEPCDAGRLSGLWQDQSSPYWFYDFEYPRLTQWVVVAGAVVAEQHYVYGTKGDTLWASGPGGERMWLVCFVNDSTAEYREWAVWKWSPGYVIRRVE